MEYQIYKLSETPSATHSVSESRAYVNAVPIDPPLRMTEIADVVRPTNFQEQTRRLGLHYLLPTVENSQEAADDGKAARQSYAEGQPWKPPLKEAVRKQLFQVLHVEPNSLLARGEKSRQQPCQRTFNSSEKR